MTLAAWNYSPPVPDDGLGALDYKELKESGKEAYSPGASTANRVFMTNWLVRVNFIDALLGFSYLDANNNVKRILPDPHPEIPTFYAEDASVEGFGVLGLGAFRWTNAKITSNYKPRDYFVLADNQVTSELQRYTSRTAAFAADYLTIGGGMKFVTSGIVLAAPPGRITTSMELQYTWHEVPALPTSPFIIPNLTAINNCIGKVNSTAFDVSGGNYPAGTVLFCGVDPKMVTPKLSVPTTVNGNFAWEITFKFLYRNNGTWGGGSSSYVPGSGFVGGGGGEIAGHNFLWDQANARWDLVTSDGTASGPRIYQSADLNTLWTIG